MTAPLASPLGESPPLEAGEPAHPYVVGAWLVTALLLWLVLHFNLLPALLAGLLVFELVHVQALRLTSVRERRAKQLAIAFIAVVVVALLSSTILGAVLFFQSNSGGYAALLKKSTEVIQSLRQVIPEWMAHSMPADADALRNRVVAWLQEHLVAVQTLGRDATQLLVRIAIGMVIGALIALRQADPPEPAGPLAAALANRAERFAEAFRRIIFAQVRIAAINAALTALYLFVILPLFGIALPLVKTMVVITFVAGLIPVVGNLLSNLVIVVVSLSVAPAVAVGSLVYLVAIHKLEYFLNARLVGTQIEARAWELLLAMLVMEAAFGIAGLIAAPIYYAYAKDELAAKGWI
jgi:predicted PurR-regulated permease PerM